MYVKKVELKYYRNILNETISFSKGINVIYGNNAQGKTNILESIYLFATGRSFRTNKDKDLIKINNNQCQLLIDFYKDGIDNSIIYKISSEGKKQIKINSVPINKIGKLMGFFNAVIFSPQDLNIIKSGPSHRRRFIDICISQLKPNYFYNLQQYIKILKNRNNLLKKISYKKDLIDTLSVWDQSIAEFGVKICRTRNDYINRLEEISKNFHKDFTNGMEDFSLLYSLSINMDFKKSDKELINEYVLFMEKTRKKDIILGNTCYGPHRDDIDLYINNLNVKDFGSQGQQRTFVLSLKMAEAQLIKDETGSFPVILLDDIMSELDRKRQHYIIRNFLDKQVIITCTEKQEIFSDNVNLINIDNGKVKKYG